MNAIFCELTTCCICFLTGACSCGCANKRLDSTCIQNAQIGMFSYTGLTAKQVDVLTNKYHIYLTKVAFAMLDACLCVHGLSIVPFCRAHACETDVESSCCSTRANLLCRPHRMAASPWPG